MFDARFIAPVQESDVFYPCRVRQYPDGWCEELIANRPIFASEPGLEPCGKSDVKSPRSARRKDNLTRSARRAAAALRRLCHAAPMSYFVTLTLDADCVDRYDVRAVVNQMSRWCDNRVRRKGLAYILVPELHKDGALHFHGFFNSALPVADSGTVVPPGGGKPRRPRSKRQRAQWLADGGHVVYNLPDWSLGFTTAIELYGDYGKAVNYVLKYVTKQSVDGKIGGRWYYHGGAFAEPVTHYLDITLTDLLPEGGTKFSHDYYVFEIPAANLVMARREYYVGR